MSESITENYKDNGKFNIEKFYNEMSKLLLDYDLLGATGPVVTIARMYILWSFGDFDGGEKGQALQLLYEAGLISGSPSIIDLTGLDLDRANLKGAGLEYVDLSGVWARGVNLENAQLNEANLICANLEGANLKNANLFKANLEQTSLKDANLQGASLKGVCMTQTDTKGTNLEAVNLEGVTIHKYQLERAACVDYIFGLESVENE